MEAYALVGNLLLKNGGSIPVEWASMLKKQCRYVSDCRGAFGEVVVFGDDDEEKSWIWSGKGADRYAYILQFMSTLLDERYDAMEQTDETLHWLFDESEIGGARIGKPLYDNAHNACYREATPFSRVATGAFLSGSTMLPRALEALPLTVIRYCPELAKSLWTGVRLLSSTLAHISTIAICPCRDGLRRRTSNHNTVCADGKDQSEMLGAFTVGPKRQTASC